MMFEYLIAYLQIRDVLLQMQTQTFQPITEQMSRLRH